MTLDIEAVLDEAGIPYRTSGKNIGRSVECAVQCPECGDEKGHCGIFPNGFWSCFVCGSKGNIQKVLRVLSGIGYTEIRKILRDNGSDFIETKNHNNKDNTRVQEKIIPLPGGKLTTFDKKYLAERGYSPKKVAQEYNLQSTGLMGADSYRIVIPVYFENLLVTYLTRDTTGRAALRYKNLASDKSILSVGDVIYNWDSVFNDTAIIVEGPMDVMRIGEGALGALGVVLSSPQVEILSRLRRAFILYDNDKAGKKKATELHNILQMCGVKSKILRLPSGVQDPGELSMKQVQKLRQEVF